MIRLLASKIGLIPFRKTSSQPAQASLIEFSTVGTWTFGTATPEPVSSSTASDSRHAFYLAKLILRVCSHYRAHTHLANLQYTCFAFQHCDVACKSLHASTAVCTQTALCDFFIHTYILSRVKHVVLLTKVLHVPVCMWSQVYRP